MAIHSTLTRLGLLLAVTCFSVASCATTPVDPIAEVSGSSPEETVEAPTTQETSSDGINADFCDEKNFTEQVTNLNCSGGLATFSSTGLPSALATLMVGITATNQQYARPHDYMLSFPLTPSPAAETTTPGSGPIGVAVDGVPLFSPWTQAETLTHTAEMGELDVCGGHAGRGDDYHYHVAPNCLIEELGEEHIETEKRPIGIANDANPILALGWFVESNNVEAQLDECRGMTDTAGKYFYNVQIDGLRDILNCFTNQVQKTSRDNFEMRVDSSGNDIVGAKLALSVSTYSSALYGKDVCYVMEGELAQTELINSNGSVSKSSGPASIFSCSPECYAEYFEPDGGYPGRAMFFEVVTTRCPTGFDYQSLIRTAAYEGTPIQKRAAKN
jgi:hypothetical protein